MLSKNPELRISSIDALNHPAFTIVLSQSPLAMRSVFDNKELINYSTITEQYDLKKLSMKKKTKKSFGGVPDKIEDMSPKPKSINRKKNTSKSPSQLKNKKNMPSMTGFSDFLRENNLFLKKE